MESRAPYLKKPGNILAIPNVEVVLKHRGDLFFDDIQIKRNSDAAELFERYLGVPDREHFVLLGLDSNQRPTHIETVAIGNLTGAIVTPREVLKSAILSNSASVYICHNHPSANPNPSPDDISVTLRMKDACSMMGINLVDHIILTRHGYTSIIADGHI